MEDHSLSEGSCSDIGEDVAIPDAVLLRELSLSSNEGLMVVETLDLLETFGQRKPRRRTTRKFVRVRINALGYRSPSRASQT